VVVFFPPRCSDCGALPGKEHLSWCPDSGEGILHESPFPLEPKQPQAAVDNVATRRVPTITIDRETLDLEALRPFFTKEALRDAVQGHLGEFGYSRAISGVVYGKPGKQD
jgi:hypothetical protein